MTADDWLDLFALCVRNRDFDAARLIVARTVYSFGTVAPVMTGRSELEHRQWEPVWTTTRDFDWTDRKLLEVGRDVLCACMWRSYRGDVERRGRATIMLRRVGGPEGSLEAIHTHFSEEPGFDSTRKD